MLPASEIAKNYRQSETKKKYAIQYGIAPHILSSLKDDFQDIPFTFMFEESTTTQVKTQYDGYVQHRSKKKACNTTAYCGSLYVGNCTANKLFEHFHNFSNNMKLNPKYLLHFGMDGPNVNKSFESRLSISLEEKLETQSLKMGSCSLHTAHNSFRAGLLKSKLDLGQLCCDIHFFFKLSSARREDYKSLEKVTKVTAWYPLKHSSTGWATFKYVVVRILEQWDNLMEYFLKFLPRQANFREIKETAQYKQITDHLNAKLAPA